MNDNETLKLKILDTDIQVRTDKDKKDEIMRIQDYVQKELGLIKSKNQFANHIHIAILGCLNITEQLFESEKKLDEQARAHDDELVYYKNLESKKNEEQDKLDAVISEKDKEIKNLQEENQEQIQRLQKQNKEGIEKLTKENEEKIALINKEKDEAIANLESQKEEAVAEITRETQERIRQLKEDKDREIKSLEEQYNEQINQVTDEKDTIILNLKEDRDAQISQLTQEKDAIITRLRKERESELRTLHQEKDLKIEQLTQDNEALVNTNSSMVKELDSKNELLNQYRQKLQQSKDENDVNRKSIIDLQNQLFENQIELAKLQKRFEEQGINLNQDKSSIDNDPQTLNELLFNLKEKKDEQNSNN